MTAQLRRRLDELVDNYRRITSVNRNMGFFTTGYNYLIQIIPALIVAPLYINREVEFGVVTQSAMAFAQLLGAFSLVINQFQSISSFAAVTARLDALAEAVERTTAPDSSAIETILDRERLAYERLTLRAVDGDGALIKDLSVSIAPGARLLVTGPNEAARVCLFRATAGLWHRGEGKITRPPLDEVLFLPQRPELPPVTLRELVLGPGRAIPDDQILAALRGRSRAHRRAGRRARRGAGLGVLRAARRPAVAGPHPSDARGSAVRSPGPRRDHARTGPGSAGAPASDREFHHAHPPDRIHRIP